MNSPDAGRKRVTMNDVARHAGVAIGTVSNCLNHPERVRPKLREVVQRSIEELGFVRNRAASNLAAGSNNTVGLVLVDLDNSYFVDMVRGAESIAKEAGFFVVIANSDIDESKQRSYLHYFDEEQVAGILLAPVGRSLAGFGQLRSSRRPAVVIDAEPERHEGCAVSNNNELAGRLAAQHLLNLGRRKLAFAGGPMPDVWPVVARLQGARAAVSAVPGASIELLPTEQIQAAQGRTVGSLIASRHPSEMPEGIIAASDLLAQGLLQTLLLESDRRVPDDIALIACDDNRTAHDSVIPISTVDLPGYEIGRAGMRLLLDEMNSSGPHRHQHLMIDPRLTARESTVGRRLPGARRGIHEPPGPSVPRSRHTGERQFQR